MRLTFGGIMTGYLRALSARTVIGLRTASRALCLMLLLTGLCHVATAQTVAIADSSVQSQQQALQVIPLNQLTEAAQAKLWPVVNSPTIYRRLPTELIHCERDMYLTLVRNPEIIASIWHLMEVTDLTMNRTGPFTFDCDDKAGTTSQVELLYGTANTHVFYATTLYEGPLFARPVKGRVVLLLRSEYLADEQGRPQVKSTMDAFIRIDHVAANLVARTLSPLVGRTADHNFVESFRFVSRVNETAAENGPGMVDLADRLEGVDAATSKQFAEVSLLVSQRAQARRDLAIAAAQRNLQPPREVPTQMQASQGEDQPTLESANALPLREIDLRR